MITQEAKNDDENTEDLNKSGPEENPTNDDTPEAKPEDNSEEKSPDESENRPEVIATDSPIENPALEAAMSPTFEESSSFEEMDKKKRLKKMLINVTVLGMSFLLMYTAFQVH